MAQIEVTESFLKLLKKAEAEQNDKGEYTDEGLFSKMLVMAENLPLILSSEAAIAERHKFLENKIQELSKNSKIEAAAAAADILKIEVPPGSSIRDVMKAAKAKFSEMEQPKEADTTKELEKLRAALKAENEKALNELNQKAESYSKELQTYKDREFEQSIIQDLYKHIPTVTVGGEKKKKFDVEKLAKAQTQYILNVLKSKNVAKFNERGQAVDANGNELLTDDKVGILSAATIWENEAAEMGLQPAKYTNGVPLGIQTNQKPLEQMSRNEKIAFEMEKMKQTNNNR